MAKIEKEIDRKSSVVLEIAEYNNVCSMDCANVVQNVIVLNLFVIAYACRLLWSLSGASLFYRGTDKEAQAN